jgi:hypothetical protein
MAKQLLGVVDVYPEHTFLQCWIEDCRIETPHRVAAVGSTDPGNYEWMHLWDYLAQNRETNQIDFARSLQPSNDQNLVSPPKILEDDLPGQRCR